jgi:hypothetical protein
MALAATRRPPIGRSMGYLEVQGPGARDARASADGERKMISFEPDMTLRWPCRAGDYVFWARCQGIFSSPGNEYKLADIWELRDGDFITITNRQVDLPSWFDLHPLEVSGSLVSWMKKRRGERYKPQQPIQGPNIWRIFAGDRIVWVGPNRGGVRSEEEGVLGVVDFKENALVYGEPFDLSGMFPAFGGFDRGEVSPEGARLCGAGWDALNRLGLPRVAAADDQWRMG